MKKILVLVCWMAGLNVFALPVAKINLRVVDEAGNPIQGANAAIHFDVFRERKVFEGVTDSNGLFCAQAETQLCITELAKKEGYYQALFKRKQTYASGDPDKLPDYKELPRETAGLQYIFRIRTQYDAQGNIISAYYGKIRGAIQMTWDKEFMFGYWLNTDPTSRSLESTHPYSP